MTANWRNGHWSSDFQIGIQTLRFVKRRGEMASLENVHKTIAKRPLSTWDYDAIVSLCNFLQISCIQEGKNVYDALALILQISANTTMKAIRNAVKMSIFRIVIHPVFVDEEFVLLGKALVHIAEHYRLHAISDVRIELPIMAIDTLSSRFSLVIANADHFLNLIETYCGVSILLLEQRRMRPSNEVSSLQFASKVFSLILNFNDSGEALSSVCRLLCLHCSISVDCVDQEAVGEVVHRVLCYLNRTIKSDFNKASMSVSSICTLNSMMKDVFALVQKRKEGPWHALLLMEEDLRYLLLQLENQTSDGDHESFCQQAYSCALLLAQLMIVCGGDVPAPISRIPSICHGLDDIHSYIGMFKMYMESRQGFLIEYGRHMMRTYSSYCRDNASAANQLSQVTDPNNLLESLFDDMQEYIPGDHAVLLHALFV